MDRLFFKAVRVSLSMAHSLLPYRFAFSRKKQLQAIEVSSSIKMDKIILEQQFNQLEKALRLIGNETNWLSLESMDPERLGEIRESIVSSQPEEIPDYSGTKTSTSNQQIPNGNQPAAIQNDKIVQTIQPNGITAQDETIDLRPEKARNLDSLRLRIRDCDRCQLCLGRKTIVFGQGNQQADLVFVGEGPGEEEDKTGLAFVGRAGKLLTQIIHSIGINREAVYICNVVKCRPPGNRNPITEEITICSPILFKQIELLKPNLIITMGNIATKALLPNAQGIMKMRGKLTHYKDFPLIPTFHPSFLLRNPSALTDVWDDMRKIRQFLFKLQSTHQAKTRRPEEPNRDEQ